MAGRLRRRARCPGGVRVHLKPIEREGDVRRLLEGIAAMRHSRPSRSTTSTFSRVETRNKSSADPLYRWMDRLGAWRMAAAVDAQSPRLTTVTTSDDGRGAFATTNATSAVSVPATIRPSTGCRASKSSGDPGPFNKVIEPMRKLPRTQTASPSATTRMPEPVGLPGRPCGATRQPRGPRRRPPQVLVQGRARERSETR